MKECNQSPFVLLAGHVMVMQPFLKECTVVYHFDSGFVFELHLWYGGASTVAELLCCV
jgi:hypothetical protein